MKNIKIIFLILAVGILTFSCKGDDDADLSGVNVEGNITLPTSISEFDTNKDMSFNLISNDGITFDEIKVYKDGAEIANPTIDNDNNSATINSSILGNFNFPDDDDEDGDDKTGSYEINTISKISNGNSFNNNFTIKVKKELTMDDEVSNVINKDTLETKISFRTRTDMADLDFVKVFWKKNFDGTYVEDTSYTFDENNKVIVFDDVVDMTTKYNLAINDSLYYKFTTQKGSLTDDIETIIGINKQDFNSSYTAEIGTNNADYNFQDQTNLAGEVTYLAPYGFSIVPGETMEFVSVTTSDANSYYDNADIVNIKDEFNSGTQVNSLSNLDSNSIIIFKTERDIEEDDTIVTKDFYGVLKITQIQLINGTEEIMSFKYKEGFIIGE